MNMEFRSRQIAELRVSGLRALRGLGFSRLQFILEVDLAASPNSPVLLAHLVADVAIGGAGGGQQLLGKAAPQSSWCVFTLDHPHKVPVWLELDLAGEQLEALERLRAGGPLTFQFHVSLQLRQDSEVVTRSQVLRLDVDITQWATVLKEIGYLDLLVVAVKLPIDAPDTFRHAKTELREAHKDLLAGRYDTTVMRCRRAMESVGTQVSDDAGQGRIRKAFAESKSSREAMTKFDRAELVRGAIANYSNLAHHMDGDGAPECFSRQDALFVLTAAAGVIWEASARIPAR